MGAKSKQDIIQEIFDALSEVEGFVYSVEELYDLLEQTDYKVPKKSTKLYPSTAWSKFMAANKKSLDDSKEIGARWKEIKESEDQTEFLKYQKLADEENIEKGIPTNPDGTTAKSASIPMNNRLRHQLIEARLNQKLDGENLGGDTKPIFSGKGVTWRSENYKQWKLASLGKSPDDKMTRAEWKTHQLEDSYTEKYDESQPWYNYIVDNMAYCEDL